MSGQYVELVPGDYDNNASLTVTGRRSLVGAGASTRIRNVNMGPILIEDANSDLTLDSVSVLDALAEPNASNGYGIDCPQNPPATRAVHVVDAIFSNNRDKAINCAGDVEVRRSIFDGNVSGVEVTGSLIVDRCTFVSNSVYGVYISGNYSITNSFFVRNQLGAFVEFASSTALFEFNTVADNTNAGLECVFSSQQPVVDARNNIIVRNHPDTDPAASACDYGESIMGSDATALAFKHADAAPYDYHINAGSIAIDAVTSGNIDHDFDGDSRPDGNASDVGADEF